MNRTNFKASNGPMRRNSPPAARSQHTLSRQSSERSFSVTAKSVPPMASPRSTSSRLNASVSGGDEISRQVAEWDALMEGLDKQQEQLLNDQWRLLRTQIGSLMGAVSEMKSIAERVTFLECFVGESAGKHSSLDDFIGDSAEKQKTMAGQHQELKATMESRLEYLEGLLGDSADRHMKEITSALDKMHDLHAAIETCAKQEHQSSLEQRMAFIEKELGESADKHDQHEKHRASIEQRTSFVEKEIGESADKHDKHDKHRASIEKRMEFVEKELGESADKHDKHKTSMEERMEFMERKLGDSAERHWKEIEAAKVKLGSLHKAVSQCATQEHHSSLEQRMTFVEKDLGESSDKHKKHRVSVEQRMKFLESKIGDSADKHWKEIEALKENHGTLTKSVSQCAKQQHHSSLEQRVTFVEKELGESADKHDQHKTSVEDRMLFLENKIGDSAEKHWKEIEALKKNHGDLNKVVLTCAKQENHSSLEKRMQFLEKELGESADKHDKHKTSMEDRMEFLETKIGDTAEKHWKEIEAAKKNHGDLHKVVEKCAKIDHASSLEKRLIFIENLVGDNADKHAKALQDHKDGLQEHKESIDTRLEYLEALIGDSADKHWKEIDAAKKKLGSVEAAVSKCAKAEHHSSLEARVTYMEKDFGDSLDAHSQHKSATEGRLEGVDRKLKEFGSNLDSKGHKSDIEKLEGIVLAGIDKRLTNIEEKHLQEYARRMNDYEKKHMHDYELVKAKVGDIDKALKECANIEQYLGLDRKHGALSQQQVEIAETVRGKMQDVNVKLDAQRNGLESIKILVEQRIGDLEAKVGDASRNTDFMREMEQRYMYMQEDQKRARDVLESSIHEQICLEHSAVHSQASQIKEQWDREVKSRQAYQENYKELLGQERVAREAIENQIGNRLENFERSIYSELQRVWHEIGKESHAPIVVKEVEKEVTPVVVQQQRQQSTPTYAVREIMMSPVMTTAPRVTFTPTTTAMPLTSPSSLRVPIASPATPVLTASGSSPSLGSVTMMRRASDGTLSIPTPTPMGYVATLNIPTA